MCAPLLQIHLFVTFISSIKKKKERVKEFAGRIEKLFKKLVDQLPERYPDKSLLEDCLFYGMQQHLRNSLRFMFQDPKCDYT